MVNTQEQNAVPDLPVAVLRSVRRLSNRRGRDLAGTFLVEGRQAVREALALGTIVTDVIVGDPAKHADLLDGADVALWRVDGLAHGDIVDRVAGLVLGDRPPLELLLVGGRPVVERDRLAGVDEERLAVDLQRASTTLLARS